jgi:DNA-binding CsgD family transcriptional regulator/tetratricopeptide (TPR) repeat protein
MPSIFDMEGLIGRHDQLAAVRSCVDAGTPVVVYGEAGVGKTALVRAALPSAAVGGALSSLSWMPFLALRRALPRVPDATWHGDAEHVAGGVVAALAGAPLVLEDLQWADAATMTVAELLAPHQPLVVSLRRGDVRGDGLREQLAQSGFRVVDLAPLDDAAAATLARTRNPRLDAALLDDVVRRSGGNPLLLGELARVDGMVDTLPLALGVRLEALGPDARSGMLLLAVADRPLPASAVRGAAELLTAGLAAGDDAALEVQHRLIAEVVVELADHADLDAAHRLLLDLLPEPADQARHLLALGDLASAHRAALAAAELATTPGERLRHLVVAADSAPDPSRASLVLRAAAAANEAGVHAEAKRLLDDLPPSLRDDPVFLRPYGEAVFGLGDSSAWQKSVIAGGAVATEPADRLYFASEQVAIAYFVEGNPERAIDLAREALEVPSVGELPHAALLRRLGAAEYLLGRPEWRDTLEHAVARARLEGDIAGTFASLNNLISAHESAGEPVYGRQLAEQAVDEAAALRLGRWVGHMECRRLSLAVYAGDHAFVEEVAPRLLTQPLMALTRTEVGFYLASTYADLGRVPEALEVAERHVRDWDLRSSDYHAVRALAFLSRGRPLAALGERGPFHEAEPVSSMRALMEPVFAWSAWSASRPLPQADEDLVGWGMLAGVAPELAGIAALEEERYDDAAVLFAEAATCYAPYHHRRTVRSRWGQGLALGRAGRRDEALGVLDEVAEEARGHRLAPMLALAVQTSRDIGGARAATAPGQEARAGLSRQEARVVSLVGEGLSDAEIARRLGVSVRTVHAQVAAARTKLGATTRHHAAELLAADPG